MRLLLFTSIRSMDHEGATVRRLVDTLRARDHRIEIVVSDHDDRPGATGARAPSPGISWKDEDAVRQAARRADECVFIIGNSHAHSAGCADWLPELGGIAYFDDVVLDRLFLGWWHADREAARAVLEAVHGALTARRLDRIMTTDPARGLRFIATTAPMGAWLAGKARGALCPSSAAAGAIAAACPGPVVVPDAILAEAGPSHPMTSGTRLPGALRVLAVLDVDNVPRVEALITAIGLSAVLRPIVDISYLALDELDTTDHNALTRRAAELGVRLTSAEDNALHAADVVADLRDPRIDAPSTVVLEAIARDIPVIVSGNGFTARIPDHIAMHVDPANEYASLTAHLTGVSARHEPSTRQSSDARSWLRQITDPEPLGDALLEVVTVASTIRPATRAIDRAGRILTGWLATTSTIEATVALDAFDLFDAVLAPPSTHTRSIDGAPAA